MPKTRFLRLSGDKGGILVNGSAKHEKETYQNEYGDKHKPPKTMRRHKHIGLYTLDAYDNPGNTPQDSSNVIESVFIHKSGFICEVKQNFSIRNIPARTGPCLLRAHGIIRACGFCQIAANGKRLRVTSYTDTRFCGPKTDIFSDLRVKISDSQQCLMAFYSIFTAGKQSVKG